MGRGGQPNPLFPSPHLARCAATRHNACCGSSSSLQIEFSTQLLTLARISITTTFTIGFHILNSPFPALSSAMAAAFTTPTLLRPSIVAPVTSRVRFESVCVGAAAPGNAHSAVAEGLEVPAVDDKEEWYEVPVHKVTVKDRQNGVTHSFFVPEDQYILQTGEEQKIDLPFSCRHGCCTACAVRVKSGQLYQPQALGISVELREKGYGLLCVGYPLSDIEVETQDEDEVYWLQFGQYFAKNAIDRDDFALELAVADE